MIQGKACPTARGACAGRPWDIFNLWGAAADGYIHLPVRGEGAFGALPPLLWERFFCSGAHCKRGYNVRGPQNLTVAILAQGTHWAVAVTQALSVAGSIPTKNIFSIEFVRHFDRATGHACWNTPE